MSHEIRTPLNAILGFAQLLQRDRGLTAPQQESLKTIGRSGEHLLALVNGILEMSKIEAGRCTLSLAPFDLHGLLEDLGRMFRLSAEAKGLKLEIQRQPAVPRWVTMDEGKLRQVLINLLNNALKYTDTGRVVIEASVETAPTPVCRGPGAPSNRAGTRSLHFCVRDTGIGIAPENLARIFDAFEQAKSPGAVREGTGLGPGHQPGVCAAHGRADGCAQPARGRQRL